MQIADIFPAALLKGSHTDSRNLRSSFWSMLRLFWTKEGVDGWEHTLFPRGLEHQGEDSVENILCLDITMHTLWNSGLFALKPVSISDDQKELTLEFFWQRKTAVEMNGKIDLSYKPVSTRYLDCDNEGNRWYRNSGELIKSGDIITMRTDDVDLRPLPSIKILEMKWLLQRIVGMSGAGEVFD